MASKKFPFVEIRHIELLPYLAQVNRKFDSIHLDFCNYLQPVVMKRIVNAGYHVNPGGVLGVCIMMGRELTYLDKIRYEKRWLSESQEAPLIARARLINDEMAKEYRHPFFPRWLARYRSNTAAGQGAPMGIYLGTRVPTDKNINIHVYEQTNEDVSSTVRGLGDTSRLLLNLSATSVGAIRANATRVGKRWYQ